jgi:YbbR domain-containing protein
MRKWVLHNLGLKLFSLFLATFLWVVVLGEQKVDVTVSVPLALNIPAALMLVNDPPESLEVHLRGPKTLVTSVTPREVILSELPGSLVEGENTIAIREDLIQVPRGIQVVDVMPRRIRVVLEGSVEREVEVSPRVEGVPPDGYVVRRVTSLPARVRIVGPPSEVRRLTHVRTLPISLNGRTTSFSTQVLLEPVGRLVRIQDGTPVSVEVEISAKKS